MKKFSDSVNDLAQIFINLFISHTELTTGVIGLGIYLVFKFIGSKKKNSQSMETENKEHEQTTDIEEIEKFRSQNKGLTDLKLEKNLSMFEGRWIDTWIMIKNVEPRVGKTITMKGRILSDENTDNPLGIIVDFDKKWESQLETSLPGQELRIRSKIRNVSKTLIFTAEGEIRGTNPSKRSKIYTNDDSASLEEEQGMSPHKKKTIENSAQVKQIIEKRSWIDERPEKLTSEFRNTTSYQAKVNTKPYKGKWIIVEGRVSDLNEETFMKGDIVVTIYRKSESEKEPEKIYRMSLILLLHFNQEIWGNDLIKLEKNEIIKACGQIDRISEDSISLTNCELFKKLT